jgi:hypothetical protein
MESEREAMQKQMKLDQLLKETAVSKLTEVMQKKDPRTRTGATRSDIMKKDKEIRKLRKDLDTVRPI